MMRIRFFKQTFGANLNAERCRIVEVSSYCPNLLFPNVYEPMQSKKQLVGF